MESKCLQRTYRLTVDQSLLGALLDAAKGLKISVLKIKETITAVNDSIKIQQIEISSQKDQECQINETELVDPSVFSLLNISINQTSFFLQAFVYKIYSKQSDIHQKQIMTHQLKLEAFNCTTVHMLKHLIEQRSKINKDELLIHFNGVHLKQDHKTVSDIIKQEKSMTGTTKSTAISNRVGPLKEFDIYVMSKKEINLGQPNKKESISLTLDMTFNKISSISKVRIKQGVSASQLPNFREVQDGLNWVVYCSDVSCIHNSSYYIVARGFGLFNLSNEVYYLKCPGCGSLSYELRNCGFIKAEWRLFGTLVKRQNSRVHANGKTLTGSLYTFKELDYLQVFKTLEIVVKPFKNIQSTGDVKLNSTDQSSLSSSAGDTDNAPLKGCEYLSCYSCKSKEETAGSNSRCNIY